jgi:outer membrane receptor protein involved in Fe transport
LQDEITIRPGLGSVDLLEGGAIGIGGGRVRHQLDGTAALSSGGVGLRLGVNWRGKYTLESRVGTITDTLRFSPVLLVNLRAFADLSRFLPEQNWAKGMRLSLNAQNLTNDRQEVHDSAGNTPLQYQPGYRDPLGRTIELELRKIF